MEHNYREIWETYVASWKAETAEEKRALFEKCLVPNSQYTDPNISVTNHDDFIDYMLDFHKQVPGGHFVTTYFQAHNSKCIARWNMTAGDGTVVGEGISYGEFNEQGKLSSETGFFESP